MVRHTLKLTLASTLFLVSGCSDSTQFPRTTLADSAGVAIVVNSASGVEDVPRWELSPQPVVDIGSGANPTVSLFRVVHVLPLEDSRVVISMTAAPRVLLIDPDGTVTATLGREGDGPGEYMGVGSVVPLGADSLAVWDPERRRISIFTEDGTLQREVDMRESAPLSWIASPNVLEPSARTYLLPSDPGSFVLFSVGMFGPGDGVRRVAAPTTRLDTNGRRLALLGSFPGEATFMSDATGTAPFPLGADAYGATVGDELIVGTAEEAEYRVYGPDGSLRRIVRWPEADRSPAGPALAAWSSFVESFLESMPPSESDGIRDILDAMPEPERLPAYGGLLSSDSGEVWIGPYHPGQLMLGVAYMGRLRVPEQNWLVFDRDGVLRAAVPTPAGFRPVAVAENRLWGIHTDELEVESVRAYDILRP